MVIFVLSFTVINIALWVILLIRFKKLFSTDSIVEKTRAQMNQMVADIDNTTDRDMFLVKESEKRIKQELAEADKKMELFKEATDRLRDMIAEADRINKISNKSKSLYQDFSKTSFGGANTASANISTAKVGNVETVEKKAATSYTREKNRKFEAQIDPEASFELNPQNDLFSSVEEQHSIIKNETTVTQDGAAYREVPLIITKVYDETAPQNQAQNQSQNQTHFQNQAPSHKSLSEQVKQLFDQGYKAEEIAAQLSCSVTEAQFIIDMI